MKSKRNHDGKVISKFFNPASQSVLPKIEAFIGKRPATVSQKQASLVVDLTLSDNENVDDESNPSKPVIKENQPSSDAMLNHNSDDIIQTAEDVVAANLELPSQSPSVSWQAFPSTDIAVVENSTIDSPPKDSIVEAISSSTSALPQAPVKKVTSNFNKLVELQIQLNAGLIQQSQKHSNPSEQCESVEIDYDKDEIIKTDSKQTANLSLTAVNVNKAITDQPASTIRSAVRFKKTRLLETLNSVDDAQTIKYISNLDKTITQFIPNRLERIELLVGSEDSSPLQAAKSRSSEIINSLVDLLKKHLEADDFQKALKSNQRICGTEHAKAIDINTQPQTAHVSRISFYSNPPGIEAQQKSDSMDNENSSDGKSFIGVN